MQLISTVLNMLTVNVHHKADIKAIDEVHSRKRSKKSATGASQFNQFMQTDYDFDALEKEILSN